jgi:hypothetical protein
MVVLVYPHSATLNALLLAFGKQSVKERKEDIGTMHGLALGQ